MLTILKVLNLRLNTEGLYRFLFWQEKIYTFVKVEVFIFQHCLFLANLFDKLICSFIFDILFFSYDDLSCDFTSMITLKVICS